jgi:CubicO group peptidase (beta-lactamase class C family)
MGEDRMRVNGGDISRLCRCQALWLLLVAPLITLLVACAPLSNDPRLPAATSADTPEATLTPLGARLDAYLSGLAQSGALRGSVLVTRGDTMLLSKGYGVADEASGAPNTVATRFRIGSITKQFTAMAILIRQEQGRLRVEDSICLYVSDCPEAWRPITLRHLLTHTSGIPNYTDLPDFPALIGTPATLDQLITRFTSLPLQFTRGARWSYSNSGYFLLGAVIERVSGQSYGAFLQNDIFAPLGMRDTGYDANSPPSPQHATGYLSAHHQSMFLDMSEFGPAGALASTVEDLYRWDRALVAHQLVSQQTMDAMFTPAIPCPAGGCALPSDRGYGYGWFIAAVSGQTLIYHLGHIDGFLTYNGFSRPDDITVVLLSNLETTAVLGDSLKLAEMARSAT